MARATKDQILKSLEAFLAIAGDDGLNKFIYTATYYENGEVRALKGRRIKLAWTTASPTNVVKPTFSDQSIEHAVSVLIAQQKTSPTTTHRAIASAVLSDPAILRTLVRLHPEVILDALDDDGVTSIAHEALPALIYHRTLPENRADRLLAVLGKTATHSALARIAQTYHVSTARGDREAVLGLSEQIP